MPSTIKTVPFQPPKKQQRQKEDAPWHQYLTIDLIWYVLGYTFFHPFVSWIVVLCLRAQYTKYEAPEMRIAIAWSMAMSVIGIFGVFSDRIAFGPHREVDLSEEVIVITGGVDGLGGLLADTYGMRNAMVAVLDVKGVDKAEAEATGVSYYQCDVGDAQQVETAAAQIIKDLGPPTILINNAGIVHTKSILTSTTAEVEQTFRVNTISHFTTLRTFLPHMISEKRGTIVTVSSVLGHLGAANLSAYCASKAALLALHHSLRAELAQIPGAEEIKTILVQPGQMSTKMFEHVHAPSQFFGPLVTPAEMAQGIIKLVDRGESGEVALPLYSRYIQVLGCLPFGIQHIARRWSGLDTAVEDGRGKIKKEVASKK